MYDAMINQNLYISEIVDPETGKHYYFHVYFYISKEYPLKGLYCAELYITDRNPHHGVLVKYGSMAFSPEVYESGEAVEILGRELFEKLPEGIKRFNAVMASGIKGNELKF